MDTSISYSASVFIIFLRILIIVRLEDKSVTRLGLSNGTYNISLT